MIAELGEKKREELKDGDFAHVDRKGERHLPINDESHVRNAMARWNQTDFESKSAKEAARKKIVAAARRHGIEISADDKIAASSEQTLRLPTTGRLRTTVRASPVPSDWQYVNRRHGVSSSFPP